MRDFGIMEVLRGARITFCRESGCLYNVFGSCSFGRMLYSSSSSSNHVVILSFDAILLATFFFSFFCKLSPRETQGQPRLEGSRTLQMLSVGFNSCIGLAYVGTGFWKLEEELAEEGGALPPHGWLVLLVQGFTWVLTTLTVSLRASQLKKPFLRLWSGLSSLLAGFLCISSVLEALTVKEASVKTFLDVLSVPGAILLLICVLKVSKSTQVNKTSVSSLYMPLNRETDAHKIGSDRNVTPFSSAGFLSRMGFWWLNPLMQKGYEKPLEEKDMPYLRQVDRAETRYNLFEEQLNRQKQIQQTTSPSIMWTIFYCHRRDILTSGFFALLKVLTLSAGPMLLNAFIKVAEGKEAFRYEGYVLAGVMFLLKCLESLSQRQWYFRSRLLGLQVRSLLSAAIYRKQLVLSNSAKLMHSSGEITNYLTVDAYRIGEFPFWLHQTWSTSLQLCIALTIVYNAVGLATISALAVIVLTVLCNTPLARLQHKFQSKLMEAQDERLKTMSEALVNTKVLKLYAWETHFKEAIEGLRKEEEKWLFAFQLRKAYNTFLFWSSPVLVSAATFGTCYLLQVPLRASNVFTFVATLRIVQDPVRTIPDVIGVVIQAKVALSRIIRFLDAPELQNVHFRKKYSARSEYPIAIKSASFSWDKNLAKPTLRDINLHIKHGEKVAICGEVGSGKSTLIAAILGEIPNIKGMVQVSGKIAYVSQTAWIQTGTIRDNILFGSPMDKQRYQDTLEKCSLVKDLDMLPFGDLTEIGERGVNLSGGQKQRVQLARALYQDANIYLLDDPFSALDAQTATSLFNEYVIRGLKEKTILLVTHQVDFLPVFDSVMLMSDGEILRAAPYSELLDSCKEFQDLVNAHKDNIAPEKLDKVGSPKRRKSSSHEINSAFAGIQKKIVQGSAGDQLIKKEEKDTGDTGLKPYVLYLNQNRGLLYFLFVAVMQSSFVAGQILQNSWMATNVQNSRVSQLRLITVYLLIGLTTTVFLFFRTFVMVILGVQSSKSLFSQLLNSLFRAPMTFFDSTPLGRILSRVSSDLSIVDLDVPFSLLFSLTASLNAYSNLGVLAFITWPVLFVSVPMLYLAIRLQRYYLTSAKELMRLNGTTKSLVANHLAESLSGAITIRAFDGEDRFFAKCMELIDKNASPFFHNFAANEWLIQRIETMSATVISSSALVMSVLPRGTFSSGFIGMALSYGLSLNNSLVFSIQNQCTLSNYIVSVERLNQYMHISSEAPTVIEDNRPDADWPAVGRVQLQDLKIRYRPDTPLVLRGINCTFEGGHKIGIVGRTGSGKSTLIGALFRLVEPAGGKIIVDGFDISTIGLHDLRSRFAIIPQDPTLFYGTVRYNLDPLAQHTDEEIWEILAKCQLQEAVQEKERGLDSLVAEDGSNWSMGQRQLFCLGRALLRRSRILVLDEATASIDNATDAILQKTIRTEFATCTVITVAHRIPTVMDSTRVLAISDGKLVEYDEPMRLMKTEGSLFAELVKEYWSRSSSQVYSP
uniref:ABC transporter C family member 10 n=1 Tax=Anthurium amnicola TaxID=1678845 RepID=A0A1D1XPI6_9ARAE